MSKILVVDDNAQNLYLARFLLEKGGHTIEESYSGEEAILAVSEKSFDLVLMDIQMPVMDGLTASKLIKKTQDSVPPIIALTAKAMTGDEESILKSGCDGYIKKPISPDEFVAQVEAYLPNK